jgi:hypothetical protein
MVSTMSSRRRWNSEEWTLSAGTSRAVARITGCPMRATFRIIYL